MDESLARSYDELPYEGGAIWSTHADHLRVVGRVFGGNPPSVDTCRVLEIGCAGGRNLVPMASSLPGATFLGLDISAVEIRQAKEFVEGLGLTNIEFRHGSTETLAPDDRFDYIILYGVYSWVDAATRVSLLEAIARHLAPGGLALVSYNIFPGWHAKIVLRDSLLFALRALSPGQDRVAAARAANQLLIESHTGQMAPKSRVWAELLDYEYKAFAQAPDYYVAHEFLESNNAPCYFYEFVDALEATGLAYVADADISRMFPSTMSTEAIAAIEQLSVDRVAYEQFLDFARNSTFRQSVICRADDNWQIEPSPESLREMWFALPEKCRVEAPRNAEESAAVALPNGVRVSLTSPELAAAARLLGARDHTALHFDELLDAATRAGTAERAEASLLGGLPMLLAAGLLRVRLAPDRFGKPIGERPVSWDVARWLVSREENACSLRHASAELDGFEAALVELLDGTRDIAALSRDVAAMAPGDTDLPSGPELVTAVRAALKRLTRKGLFPAATA